MALAVRVHKYCKYVFFEFIVCFFAYSLVGRHYLNFLSVCFYCSENRILIDIQRLYPYLAKLADADN